ncbi:recombinase family protein, partial [Pseudomonas aeruginosa]|nr:recombinase family protein [Pseudomonas aeruginosa]
QYQRTAHRITSPWKWRHLKSVIVPSVQSPPSMLKLHDFCNRAELTACLRSMRKGDTLVVWKLDRLARSLKDLVEIIHDLDKREIGFRSLTESIDTTSAGGRLVFHLFGALAEFEHALIQERTKAGLAAARARGRKGGRKPSLSPTDVRKAAAMLADPLITKTEVASHFGVSRVTLNAALARDGYSGLPGTDSGAAGKTTKRRSKAKDQADDQ